MNRKILAIALVVFLSGYALLGRGGQSLEEKTKGVVFPAYATQSPRILHAYKIAVAEPEVLKAVPCYCSCATIGHKSLYNCFIDDYGRFTDHGAYCNICINEATESYNLFKKGKSLKEIRQWIDAKYYGRYGIPTPTPPPA